jgi:hypothetical protein
VLSPASLTEMQQAQHHQGEPDHANDHELKRVTSGTTTPVAVPSAFGFKRFTTVAL